jgi:hypothetical protein
MHISGSKGDGQTIQEPKSENEGDINYRDFF